MQIDVITIFPDYFAPLRLSLVGKALSSGLIDLAVHDLRDFTHDIHRSVDDTPYGGGAGMVMKPGPWGEALDAVLAGRVEGGASGGEVGQPDGQRPVLVVPSPSGWPLTQRRAQQLANCHHLVFACGRYEGIDQRVVEWAGGAFDVREISLGDYVLNGGEVAALAIIEATVRLLPGVLGNPESLVEESYAAGTNGLLEYPVYTKPATWRGFEVPDVLLSGHHGNVAAWRRQQSLHLTAQRRPDLLG